MPLNYGRLPDVGVRSWYLLLCDNLHVQYGLEVNDLIPCFRCRGRLSPPQAQLGDRIAVVCCDRGCDGMVDIELDYETLNEKQRFYCARHAD